MSDWSDYSHADDLGDAFWDAAAPHAVAALVLMRHEGHIRANVGRHRHPATRPAQRLANALLQIPETIPGFQGSSVTFIKTRATKILDRICRLAGFSPDPDGVTSNDPEAKRQAYRVADPEQAAGILASIRLEQVLDTVAMTIVDVPARLDDPLRGIDRLVPR